MQSRILQLITALRASGVRVSLAESTVAFQAIDMLGIQNREEFRISLRATLIKDARDQPLFDTLFPLFFGSNRTPAGAGDISENLTPAEAQQLADALQFLADRLRSSMERLLQGRPLSSEELERLARLVGLNNTQDLHYQKWMAQRMERALSFPEVRKALQKLLELLQEMGLTREKLDQISKMLQSNMLAVSQQLDQYSGQRIAENISNRAPSAAADGLMDRPFRSLSEEEKRLLMNEVKRLAVALRTRIALRQKHAKSGELDVKATIRANLKYQGVPMEIRHHDNIKKPKIVVICDVSTSMRFCSELMLGFLFALQGQVRKTHAFAFIDHLEYISTEFTGTDANEAISTVLKRMPAGSYNTDLGWSLKNFDEAYLDTLDSHTTLIVVGDGRNNYNDPRLDLFSRMAYRTARTVWLNPEPPALWGTGDSDMPGYAALSGAVLKVGNLTELSAAVDYLMTV